MAEAVEGSRARICPRHNRKPPQAGAAAGLHERWKARFVGNAKRISLEPYAKELSIAVIEREPTANWSIEVL